MRCLIFCCLILLGNGVCLRMQAQEDSLQTNDPLDKQTDITDVLRDIFNKKPKEMTENKASVAILPVLGYNPSFGFNIGVNLMAGKQFGTKSTTIYSVFNLTFSYSTKQIVPLRMRHNMFTPENKWNWFCFDNVPYHGKLVTIIWDKDGTKYKKGKGLSVWVNGKKVVSAEHLQKVTGNLE